MANAYEVKIGELTISPAEVTAELVVCELHVDMISMVEVSFTAQDKFKGVKIGQAVTAKMGGKDDVIFTGVVAETRLYHAAGKTSMRVVAFDPLIKLHASRVSKTFEKQLDSEIVSAVVSKGGAGKAVVDATSGKSDWVVQRNESNLTFLKRLAARNGYHLRANAKGEIEFKKAQFKGTEVDVPFDNVVSLEYRMSTVDVPPSVKVIGWDYNDKKELTGTADSGKVDPIGGGKNVVSDTEQLLWKEANHVSDVLATTQGGVDAMAAAELNRAARNFLRGVVRVTGNAALEPGKLVKISGSGAGFNLTGYIVNVRHQVDASASYTSEVHFISNTYPT